ncbi:helix-turn-helix domain-containing protein [Butyrivibrio sp. YAB3001]|uniref:helix-turn-helix domain-containing protein n=1 Tax=Butyrivibrio sp. YAB3001 TaxID=1520812 RepID=UPI0008F61F77|nr:helix-turn-helix transcriptional regulator [Butyrivibrio sp. YAB3001]SFC60051.1 DNA-binding transcriptional regulator, XRE-family HTH domain [Butyrivibrio sp. YAB3001]
MNENYGNQIKEYRISLGLTQNQVATEMNVTPGYISNVENGRTAMSLRMLIYYAKLMGITLDALVGQLEPEYKSSALDNALLREISKLDEASKEKLLKTIKIWNS